MNGPQLNRFCHPLTLGGVSAFASSSWRALAIWQGAMAALLAAAGVWVVAVGWSPVLTEATSALAEPVRIDQGRFQWSGESPTLLAENRFLSVSVNLDHLTLPVAQSDIQLEAGARELRLRSLFGYWPLDYARLEPLFLTPTELQAWWNTWQPFLLGGLFLGLAAVFWLSWYLILPPYAAATALVVFYGDRLTPPGGVWRLAAGALLPGSLVVGLGVVLYGTGHLGLVGLLVMWLVHFPVGLAYAIAAPVRLPLRPDAPPRRANPFAG